MAITIENLFAAGFSGKVGGNMVFRRRKSGKIVIAKAPKKSDVPPSEKQRELRNKFARGTAYAKRVRDNAELYALYAMAVEGDQIPTNLAVRDSYTPPRVKSIDVSGYSGLPGDSIRIKAVDDFRVDRVRVQLLAPAGNVWEEGEAVQSGDTDTWVYTATEPNKQLKGALVRVVAFDLPGNEGVLETKLGGNQG